MAVSIYVHAINLLSTKISDETNDVKRSLGGTLSSITPFIGSMVNEKAPITDRTLQTAAQTDRAKQKNKIKSCSTVRKPGLQVTHPSPI